MNPREQMTRHLNLLFADSDPGQFINLRAIPADREKNVVYENFFPVADFEAAIEFAVGVVDTHDVYVGALARDRASGGKDAVGSAQVLWVDCDSAEASEAVADFEIEPSMVVASGTQGNCHVYWFLDEPVSGEQAENLNHRLALRLRGDVACRDLARILRVPGTLNHKFSPPNPVTSKSSSGSYYPVSAFESVLEELPDEGTKLTVRSARESSEGPSRFVQNALDKLDGVKKGGKGWKALCPAHDDHKPSLSVDQGDDGRCLLHCFAGCEFEAIAAAIGLSVDDLMPTQARKSVASRVVDLVMSREVELFHTPDGRSWVQVDHDGRLENWPVMSGDAEQWFRQIFYDTTGNGLSREAVGEAQSTLDAVARFGGPEREVAIRVAGSADREVFVDVGDAARTVIRVDSKGFDTTKESPACFYRSPSSTELAIPDPEGSVDLLWEFLSARDEQTRMRLIGYLVMCFHPVGPYPVLNIHGEQGSAKSTLTRMVLDLVDPHKAGLLSGTPRAHDLAITASTNHLIALDNVSSIKQGLSDTLCRISTGGGLRTRRLYTDADEVVLEFCRPVVINGIGQVIHRPDLLERTAPIELKAIAPEDRLPEGQIWANWEKARPVILGGLLNAVSTAIRNLDAIDLPGLPRLADWARWGEAAGPALGWEPGSFVTAIDAGQDEQVELSIDDVIEIRGLIEYMADTPEVRLTATELLEVIHQFLDIDPAGRQDLLRRGADLSRELKVFAPALRKHGIECEFGREGGGTRDRYILVRKVS